MTRDTYVVGEAHNLGRVTQIIGGKSVVIGEELCMGCDEPVADGPCSCERKATRETERKVA